MEPLIAVLAGGASLRMGVDKALVTVGDRTMLDLVGRAAAPVGEVVVVGSELTTEWESIADETEGRLGPVAGLVAALVRADGRDVALVAVDQPFLRPDTLRRLLGIAGDAVVPVDAEWEQVTCAVYRAPCLAPARDALAAGRSLRHVVGAVGATRVEPAEWRSWGEDGRSWYSVDTPAALAAGLERYGAVS
jgi:molybdopterin-guanine dinucleotide biosynthesis protein A